ncbi:hypothetical protein B0H66DRAFT_535203 [Apodospora peruviana]|uniref:Ecp2 effector protein-like domain-containing protein n=1 Tax=Apodospora peruviana TaxID=516989 RepID=A0AAE0I1W4_9PEZI|nr:hypothetical protein B0H66DRAFT_535203 [Apodospora peruviana]
MHTSSLRILVLQAIVGLAAGAVLSNAPASADLTTRQPSPESAEILSGPNLLFTPVVATRDANAPSLGSPKLLIARKHTKKRLNYTDNAPGEDNYCGESVGANEVFDPATTPLQADCNAIAAKFSDPVKGYWTIFPSDQAAAPGGWVTLAKSGTCAFKVRLDPPQTPQTFKYGTNDVRFFTTVYSRDAQGGHIQAESGAACMMNGKMLIVSWKLVKP